MEDNAIPTMYHPTTLPVNDLTFAETHLRLQYAIDNPIAFVQRLKSCLLALDTFYEVEGPLADLTWFLASAIPEQLEADEHDRIMKAIEHEEVLLMYLTCVLTRRTWMEREEGMAFKNVQTFMRLLLQISHLLTIAERSKRREIFAGPRVYETLTQTTQFFQFLWGRRKLFFSSLPSDQIQTFAAIVVDCMTILQALYRANGIVTGFVIATPEIGSLLAYWWSHTKRHPRVYNLGYLLNTLDTRDARRAWDYSGQILMSDPEDAKDVLEMCIWSIHNDVIDGVLGILLIAINRFTETCHVDVFPKLQECWIRLLRRIVGALEQQTCSGNKARGIQDDARWGFRIAECVHFVTQADA
ncbi:hypothetical protein EIP86_000245 [Pleurotus ostreatoroseus]|nr:hypothetical protein EIP86_000245 [Pleurotus ostreatoroseus]